MSAQSYSTKGSVTAPSETHPRRNSSKEKRLFRFDQVPSYMQCNPYVRSGYRVYLTKEECLASIFSWTNETINIWSHIAGFVIFTGFLFHDIYVTIPTLKLTYLERCSVLFFVLSCMLLMACSAAYHTFNCHSEEAYRNFLKWDVASVTLSIVGVFVLGVHSTFSCYKSWCIFYEIIVAVVSVSIMWFHFNTKERSEESHHRMTMILAGWVVGGLIPPFHFAYVAGGLENPVVRSLLGRVVLYYSIMGGAFLIYLTFYPERCFPGRLDFFGSSHQLWHVLVLAGLTWWHQSCLKSWEMSRFYGC